MKFLEISVGKSLNINTGEEWYKGDCRVSVEDGENPDDVFREAKAKIDSWLPNPHHETLPLHPVKIEKMPEDERRQSLIDTIKMCTTLKFLENFRAMANKDGGEVLKAFNSKLKELSK